MGDLEAQLAPKKNRAEVAAFRALLHAREETFAPKASAQRDNAAADGTSPNGTATSPYSFPPAVYRCRSTPCRCSFSLRERARCVSVRAV